MLRLLKTLRSAGSLVLALGLGFVIACKGEPDPTPWCSLRAANEVLDNAPTYFQDVRPILAAKCVFCHVDGGQGPFALDDYGSVFARRTAIAAATREHRMPPWLAARCCTDYFEDYSLTEAELATILTWAGGDAAEGDRGLAAPLPDPIGGLSRVDATVAMPEPYTPHPEAGSTDDTRCFVLDWPVKKAAFVTGLNPIPGQRSVVHHLIVGALGPEDAKKALERDRTSPEPGFACSGGLGEFPQLKVLGGGLQGGEFPRGIGTKVEPGSKILLNIHYSTAVSPPKPDQTSLEFRVDASARDAKAMVIANLAWLVGDGMLIRAGDADAAYFYRFVPDVFTAGKPALLQSVTPHMHQFATRMVVRRIKADGTRECLLEIPNWEFGHEQPFWFAREHRLDPGDELYLECHFDNSANNQPNGGEPRDIAWGGNNQDMCAAFLSFTQ